MFIHKEYKLSLYNKIMNEFFLLHVVRYKDSTKVSFNIFGETKDKMCCLQQVTH